MEIYALMGAALNDVFGHVLNYNLLYFSDMITAIDPEWIYQLNYYENQCLLSIGHLLYAQHCVPCEG